MKPSIGRIVHYVIPSGPLMCQHRPAIITAVFPGNTVNLSIFLDQEDDCSVGSSHVGYVLRAWSISMSEEHAINTWHWPEREE